MRMLVTVLLCVIAVPSFAASAGDSLSFFGFVFPAPDPARWKQIRSDLYLARFAPDKQQLELDIATVVSDELGDDLEDVQRKVPSWGCRCNIGKNERARLLASTAEVDRSGRFPVLRYDVRYAVVDARDTTREFRRVVRGGGLIAHPEAPSLSFQYGFAWVVPPGAEPVVLTAADSSFVAGMRTTAAREPDRIVKIGGSPHMVAVGFGSLWVTTLDGNEVVRIDPASGNILARIPTGHWTVGVAVTSGAVWVANRDDGTVTRIDPATNGTSVIKVGGKPQMLAEAAGSLWVTLRDEPEVRRIDLATGERVPGGVKVPKGQHLSGIAGRNDAVFVTDFVGRAVHRIDPASGKPVWGIRIDGKPNSVAIVDERVWVTDLENRTVVALDAATGEVRETVAVGAGPNGLLWHEGELWVTNAFDGTLARLGGTPPVVISIATVALYPLGIADDETGLWIADGSGGTVRHVRW